MACTCTKSRLKILITVSLCMAAKGLLLYYIWYITYYKYNIADHVHTIRFSKSDHEVRIIWRRKDWHCWAEIYKGRFLNHEIDLERWFISNKRENSVWLESGNGPGLLISVHEDLPNITSTVFCLKSGYSDCCSYFNLNNLHWYQSEEIYEAQNLIYQSMPFVTTERKRAVDKFWDFLRQNLTTAYSTTDFSTTGFSNTV